MHYHIIINEEQRQIIENALRANQGLFDEESEECILLELIDDLPTQETQLPGCIHGLCL
jgi:hypothetical protein